METKLLCSFSSYDSEELVAFGVRCRCTAAHHDDDELNCGAGGGVVAAGGFPPPELLTIPWLLALLGISLIRYIITNIDS